MLGIVQSIIVLTTLFALVISAASQILYLCISSFLPKVSPVKRSQLLLVIACAPIVIALFLVSVIFLPSFMTLFGLSVDHCLTHGNHHAHLCFIHPPEFIKNPWVFGFSLLALVQVSWKCYQTARQVQHGKRILQELRNHCKLSSDMSYRVIDENLIIACSMGMIKQSIFISETLRKQLTAEELEIVICHEKEHAKRFDALKLFLASMFCSFFLPPISKRLLADMVLASEQACDQYASNRIKNKILVAKTILKVQKLILNNQRYSLQAMHFSESHIAKRVEFLIEESKGRIFYNGILPKYALFGSLLLLVLLNYDSIHHWVETVYFSVFT